VLAKAEAAAAKAAERQRVALEKKVAVAEARAQTAARNQVRRARECGVVSVSDVIVYTEL